MWNRVFFRNPRCSANIFYCKRGRVTEPKNRCFFLCSFGRGGWKCILRSRNTAQWYMSESLLVNIVLQCILQFMTILYILHWPRNDKKMNEEKSTQEIYQGWYEPDFPVEENTVIRLNCALWEFTWPILSINVGWCPQSHDEVIHTVLTLFPRKYSVKK